MKKRNWKRWGCSAIALLLVLFMVLPNATPLIQCLQDWAENIFVWIDFSRPDALDGTDVEDDTSENTEEIDEGDDIYEVILENAQNSYSVKEELEALGLEDATLVHYDAYSHTYLVDEHQYVTVFGGDVGTYTDENGKVQLIDNTLMESEMTLLSGETVSGVANTANAYTVLFPYKITEEAGIAVTDGEHQIEVIPLSGDYSEYTIKDNTILYNNVYKNTCVQYSIIGNRIKEDIILLQQVEQATYSYELNIPGLTAVVENNQVLLYPEGATPEDVVYILSAPYMEDAQGAISSDIEVSLSEKNGKTILTVTPDKAWLADEERVYPVYIDPSISSEDEDNNITFELMGVEEGAPDKSVDTYGYLYVGYEDGSITGASGGHQRCRIFVHIDMDFGMIPDDAKIDRATFSFSHYTNFSKGQSLFDIYTVDEEWPANGRKYMFWTTQPSSYTYVGVQKASAVKKEYINYDVTKVVNNWKQGVVENNGLMLKGSTTGTHKEEDQICEVYNYKKAPAPRIVIEWSSAVDPFLAERDLDDTTVNIRPITENTTSGVQQVDAVFADGLATAGATVRYTLYANGKAISTATSTEALGEYAYPNTMEYVDYFPNATPYNSKQSNWQSGLFVGITTDTLYQIKATASKEIDGTLTQGKEVTSDTFLIYQVKDFDTLPRIAQHYGVELDTIMKDNGVQDVLVVAGNTLFIRNPKTTEPYNPTDLSENDMMIVDGALLGRGLHCEFGYEPINLNTGNFYMGQTDASITDFGGEFTIGRTYNSLSASLNSMFGRGWSFVYDQAVSKSADGTIIYRREDGSLLYFTKKADGSYSAPTGYVYTLTETTYEVTKTDGSKETETGWAITDADQNTYLFNKYGMLLSVTDEYDFVTQLIYDESYNLSQIITPSGKVFAFQLDAQGRIIKMVLPNGKAVTYKYDTAGNLTAVTNPNGDTRTYKYDSEHQMTSWADENGNTVIVNVYDAEGRVVKQTDANGGVVTLTYGTNTTTTIDAEGNQTVYKYDDSYRTTSITYPDGSYTYRTYNSKNELATERTQNGTKHYTYDKFGNIATETREDGAKATYTYNSDNKLVKVVGYEGGTVTYAYNSTQDMVTYTQPDGSRVTYTYDSLHRMVSQTDGRGVKTTYTYDGPNLIAYKDGEGHTWTFAYDAMNRLVSSSDPLGNKTTYTYDNDGNKTSETAPDGGRTTYQLDALGNILTETDPMGNTTTYSYDKMYNIVKETDALGNSITYQYDRNGEIIAKTDALGNTITYTRDSMGRIVKEESTAAGTRLYEYDLSGNLVKVTNGEGQVTVSEYNTQGLVTKITDALGNVTRYTYDALGNETSVIYADGTKEEKAYDTSGRLIREVDELGVVITYSYDANGNVIKMSDDSGRSYTYEYDKNNHKVKETNPEGGVCTYTYDAAGRQISYTDEEGNQNQYTYDANGRVISQTDALGHVTTYTYDKNGSLKTSTDALGNVTTFTYDAIGHMTSMTDAMGNLTLMKYNEAGLLYQTIDSLKGTTTYIYDAAGNVTQMTDALGNVYTYTYDKNGKNTSVAAPQDTVTTMKYDAIGQLIYAEDANGLVITYAYNSVGQLVTQRDNAGNEIYYTYDAAGNILTQKDQLERVTTYTYDKNGLLTQVKEADGSTTVYEYDTMDRVVAVTDAEGTRTTFTYDMVGNQTAITEEDGATYSYEYDALNRLIAVTDPLGQVERYTYDANGNVLTYTDANGTVVCYTYDANDNVLTRTDGNGGITTYAYDELNRVIAETSPEGETVEYRYDALGNLTKYKEATGAITQYRYDSLGNMVQTISPKGKVTAYTYDKHGNVLTETDPLGNVTTYEYDLNDQLTRLTQANGGIYTYCYDAVGRLASVTTPLGFVTTFAYDLADNVILETNSLGQSTEYSYDRLHRLTSSINAQGAVTSFSYDIRNNLVSETNALGYTDTYAYDVLGRLVEEKNPLGDVTTYTYDPVGNLEAVLTPQGAQTTYSYDSNYNLIAVTDPLGNSTSYAYDKSNRLTGITDALKQAEAYEYDAAGRVISATDKAGNSTGYTYDAHGNVITVTSRMGLNTHYSYDDNDNLIEVEDTAGNKTTYSYDSMGWLISYVSALGKETTYTYDLEGNQTLRTDATGRSEAYEYDAAGRLIAYTSAGGTVTRYDYDELNQLIEQSYASTSTETMDEGVTYGYDALGQRISMLDSIGEAAYEYDALGRIIVATDSAGQTVTYTYDAEGNLSSIGYPDGTTVTYGYDLSGNLTSVTDGNGETTYYKYDALNRMVETIRPNYLTTYVTYDELDHITQLVTRNIITGRLISSYTYTYNADGYVTSEIVEEAIVSELFEASFEEFLDIILTGRDWQANETVQTVWQYFYQALHIVCDHTDADGDGNPDNCRWANLTTTTEYRYYYDANWQLTKCTEMGEYIGTTTYEYWYDEDGNRTRYVKTYENETVEAYVYTYNDSNQLVSRANQTFWGEDITYYTYDADGNMISEKTGLWETTYEYTAENRLSVVRQQGVVLMAALYDGDGNRLFTMDYTGDCEEPKHHKGCAHEDCFYHDEDYRKECFENGEVWIPEINAGTDAGTGTDGTAELTSAEEAMRELASLVSKKVQKSYAITEYVNDITYANEEVLMELDAIGNVKKTYTYGLERISCTTEELGSRVTNTDKDTFFYLTDASGSVAGITSEWGRILETYAYDPYGNLTEGIPSGINYYGYNGEATNLWTGLQYLRARYYDMANGSFLSEDTYAGKATEPLTLNRYTYVSNNPVNYNDPSGHVIRTNNIAMTDGGGRNNIQTNSSGPNAAKLQQVQKNAAQTSTVNSSGLQTSAGASAAISGNEGTSVKVAADDADDVKDSNIVTDIVMLNLQAQSMVEEAKQENWNNFCDWLGTENGQTASYVTVGVANLAVLGAATYATAGLAAPMLIGALAMGGSTAILNGYESYQNGENVYLGTAKGFAEGSVYGAAIGLIGMIAPMFATTVLGAMLTEATLETVLDASIAKKDGVDLSLEVLALGFLTNLGLNNIDIPFKNIAKWLEDVKMPKFVDDALEWFESLGKGGSVANTLTDAQKSRLNALENTINDHLTDGDFSGTLRDLQGNPVPNGRGGYFDHLGEMQDSYKSLQKIKKALEGSLKNPNLSDVDRALLQEGLDKANSYINKIEELFDPYGGIN